MIQLNVTGVNPFYIKVVLVSRGQKCKQTAAYDWFAIPKPRARCDELQVKSPNHSYSNLIMGFCRNYMLATIYYLGWWGLFSIILDYGEMNAMGNILLQHSRSLTIILLSAHEKNLRRMMIIWAKHGRLLSWLPTSSLAPLMLQHYSVGFDEIVGVSLLSRWHAFLG